MGLILSLQASFGVRLLLLGKTDAPNMRHVDWAEYKLSHPSSSSRFPSPGLTWERTKGKVKVSSFESGGGWDLLPFRSFPQFNLRWQKRHGDSLIRILLLLPSHYTLLKLLNYSPWQGTRHALICCSDLLPGRPAFISSQFRVSVLFGSEWGWPLE